MDVLVDQLLSQLIIPSSSEPDGVKLKPEQLFGKAAVANAKLAYQSYKKIFSGEKWEKLIEQKAKVQRPLWASTGTKNPLYNDVKYVETLIGPDTVNTLPDETIDAFADHGKIEANSIEQGIVEAGNIIDDLKKLGINVDFVTTQLLNDGIQKFIEPYDNLMKSLTLKRFELLAESVGKQSISYGKSKSEVNAAFKALNEMQLSQRLFAKDPYLWSSDQKQIEEIKIRIGWLDSASYFLSKAGEIEFAC